MNNKKVGVLGGTFNPIHIGHLVMAEQAMEQFGLQKIIFLPSKNPPHKNNEGILPYNVRREMVLLAIENNKRFEFSDMELKREGITYTVDTLGLLSKREPQSEWFFLLGADSLFQFTTWKEPKKILMMATVLAASRYGVNEEEMEEQRKYLISLYGGKIELVRMPQISISSKDIRERRKRGVSVRYFIPDAVYQYMEENNLYR